MCVCVCVCVKVCLLVKGREKERVEAGHLRNVFSITSSPSSLELCCAILCVLLHCVRVLECVRPGGEEVLQLSCRVVIGHRGVTLSESICHLTHM